MFQAWRTKTRNQIERPIKAKLSPLTQMKAARLQRTLTGRDIINALAGSPLAEVTFERLSVKSKVCDVDL
jgi:hypothetical protein